MRKGIYKHIIKSYYYHYYRCYYYCSQRIVFQNGPESKENSFKSCVHIDDGNVSVDGYLEWPNVFPTIESELSLKIMKTY